MKSVHIRLVLGLCGAVALTVAAAAFWTGRGEASPDAGVSVSASQQKTLTSTNGIDEAYLAGAEKTARCLTDAGLKDVAMARDSAGKISFTWGGFPTREEAQKAGEIYKQCYFANMDDIDRYWQQTPQREVEATERGWVVMRCIQDAHPDLTFGGDESAVNAQIATLDRGGDEATRRCVAAAGTDILKFTPLPR